MYTSIFVTIGGFTSLLLRGFFPDAIPGIFVVGAMAGGCAVYLARKFFEG